LATKENVMAKKPKAERKPAKSGKQLYDERKKAGLCVSCGVRKSLPGRVECAFEIEAAKAYRALKQDGKKWDMEKFKASAIGQRALNENKLTEEPETAKVTKKPHA
jgi:hypothetical protein